MNVHYLYKRSNFFIVLGPLLRENRDAFVCYLFAWKKWEPNSRSLELYNTKGVEQMHFLFSYFQLFFLGCCCCPKVAKTALVEFTIDISCSR